MANAVSATTGIVAVRRVASGRIERPPCRPRPAAAGPSGPRPAVLRAASDERLGGPVAASTVPKPCQLRARHERASGSSRCRRRSGRAQAVSLRRILRPWRSGSCSRRTTISCARACAACSKTSRSVEVVAVCGDLDDGGRRRGSSKRRTSSSPTSACRRRHSTRACRSQSGCARITRAPASSSSASTSQPSYALAMLEHGTAGRAYLLKERVDDVEQLVGRHPVRRRRRLDDRPQSSWRP